MHLDLKNFNSSFKITDNTYIKSVDSNLNDWIQPLVEAFKSTPEISVFYVEAHKKALENDAQFYHFTLYNDNQSVSSLTISVCDTLVRIDDVGTLPVFQKRGFATLLVQYALQKSIELGCTDCFLCASTMGLHLYQKIGFKIVSENRCYVYQIKRY